MTEPEGDGCEIDAGLEQVHRGRMPLRMRRDATASQLRSVIHGDPHGDLHPLLGIRPTHPLASSTGEDRRLSAARVAAKPPSQRGHGGFPERYLPQLSTLP